MRKRSNDALTRSASVRPERRPKAIVEGHPPRTAETRRSTSLGTSAAGDRHTPERTCVLTRRKGAREDFLRLALGPNGEVGPDVRARAPGRGAWVAVGRTELDAANAKGALKGALARAFKSSTLAIPADLGDRAAAALRQAALDRLGMEARSGTLINGAERIEAAARAGGVHLLVHAADSAEDGRRRLDQAWRVGGGPAHGLLFPEGRTILSMALGRENVVHVALTDPAAASRVHRAIARWRAFTDPDQGLKGGEPARSPGSADDVDADQTDAAQTGARQTDEGTE